MKKEMEKSYNSESWRRYFPISVWLFSTSAQKVLGTERKDRGVVRCLVRLG
jgi:hypothetical protein